MYEYISVNRHELNVGKQPAPLLKEHPDALSIMAVGQPVPYSTVRIAGDDDQELPENHIGHILIAGENVTKGYFENPEANAKGFTAPDASGDRWLRTGDLGMMKGGKLFITGRAKEIIFVNGQNYYPHDIENIAIRAEGLELGKVVAAGVRPKGASTDDLILFVLHRMDMKEFLPVASASHAPRERTHRPRGRARGAGEARAQDDQRQDPARIARGGLREWRVRRRDG